MFTNNFINEVETSPNSYMEVCFETNEREIMSEPIKCEQDNDQFEKNNCPLGRHESVYSMSFPSEMTSDDITLLTVIVKFMPDITEEIFEFSYGIDIDYLKASAQYATKAKKFPYAVRYLIEVVMLSIEKTQNPSHFCVQIESLLNEFESEPNVKLSIETFLNSVHRLLDSEPNIHAKLYSILGKNYKNVVKELNLDDAFELDENLANGSYDEKLEYIFISWVYNNNYQRCLPNIDYFRDCVNKKYSVGYENLRQKFNEGILNTVSDRCIRHGALLLKMAYKIREYNLKLAQKFVSKAELIFLNCKYKLGKHWAVVLKRQLLTNEYVRYHANEEINMPSMTLIEKSPPIWYCVKGCKRIRLS